MSPTQVRTVVTTTLWGDEPTSSVTATNKSGTSIPVGVIVGGTLGGACLAILVVFTWTLWGRSIRRQKRKQEKELRNLRITDKNTRLNAAALSRPRKSNYLPPVFWPPPSSKVKFADGGVSGRPAPSEPEPQSTGKENPVDPPIPVRRPRPVAFSSDPHPTAGVIFPWRKKSAERMAAAAAARSPSPQGSDNTSYYSAASGDEEEAQEREAYQPETTPADEIQRLSRTSSTWSFLLRNGFRRAPSNGAINANRNSQATSASVYSQPDEPLPVGVAI
ncbi:hypothetical protein BDZ89DRAFT_1126347 [Hymenopellis radicata]|nr:hypothetical protein BDZ89DRAFT_1126347 [Hymenopellis radicata]